MNIMVTAPSIFETFNARNLDPIQVASRFIPPRHFDELVIRSHSIVVGPRGSGKTTLLKMLQLPALRAWNHSRADHFRSSIDFTGVFIAADVSWGAQLAALGGKELPEDLQQALGHSAFTTHILMALTKAMREVLDRSLLDVPTLTRFHAELSAEKEAELVRELAENWELSVDLPTLSSLQTALRKRLADIDKIANRLSQTGAAPNDPFQDYGFVYIGPLASVSFGIEQFNSKIEQPYRKWGLLFDELEIAPYGVRQSLLRSLRSTNQNILFKLSMSPYSEDADLLRQAVAAMPGQDFQPIELWYARKEQGFEFSRALLQGMLAERGRSDATPEQIFGRSVLGADDEDREVRASSYRPGSPLQSKYVSLALRDPSFVQYLDQKHVDLNGMHLMRENDRAGAVRKISSIVAVRETYRGRPAGRSRKNPYLYTGAEALFAVVEGNPRWLIGLMGPLLRRFIETGKQVPRSLQANAVTVASNRFRALLRTIPYIPQAELDQRHRPGASRGLLSLLDHIGDRFHRYVVIEPFSPEPVLSFTVDASASGTLQVALGKALNSGAIILVPDNATETIASSVVGKRFRLSYMLAPHYKIPLLLGTDAQLKRILAPIETDSPLFEGAPQ